MEHGFKLILIFTAVIIVAIITTIIFMLMNASRRITSVSDYANTAMDAAVTDNDITKYVGLDLEGSTVMRALEQLVGQYVVEVTTNTVLGTNKTVYSNVAEITQASDKTQDSYINPSAMFSGSYKYDNDGLKVGLAFTQISIYKQEIVTAPEIADFPEATDLYRLGASFMDLAKNADDLYKQLDEVSDLVNGDMMDVYNYYAECYGNLLAGGLDEDEEMLFKYIIFSDNTTKTWHLWEDLQLYDEVYDPNGDYAFLPDTMSSSRGAGFFCKAPAGLLSDYDHYRIKTADNKYYTGKEFYGGTTGSKFPDYNKALIDVKAQLKGSGSIEEYVYNIGNRLQGVVFMLQEADATSSNYERILRTAKEELQETRLAIKGLYFVLQDTNTAINTLNPGGSFFRKSSVFSSYSTSIENLYTSVNTLGSSNARFRGCDAYNELETMYKKLSAMNIKYDKCNELLSTNGRLNQEYVVNTLGMLNKLVDVNSLVGGASTDNNDADVLDKALVRIESTLGG